MAAARSTTVASKAGSAVSSQAAQNSRLGSSTVVLTI